MLNPDIGRGSFSQSNTIGKFYSSINNKDLNQLALLISGVSLMISHSLNHFKEKGGFKISEQLTTSMGQNTGFSIDNIYEGVDLTAIVEEEEVPFSKGCSYYELSRNGEQLLIKNAQVITESSMKPQILALFNMVTSVFDDFPEIYQGL
ncbi:hypothetical protein HAX54_046738 [Datura stramonium]|uniref:Uncharacterized protein n=1 Tax=Datura stramonium TaxID=4076 RepID=A0ABS8SS61_DATST|nr:hypothetical protein [Datura stramonium]